MRDFFFLHFLDIFFVKMAYICFCRKRQILGNVKSLLTHICAIHYVNSSLTIFQCSESGCGWTFSLMWSYKRHISWEHVNQNEYSLEVPLEGLVWPVDSRNAGEKQDQEVEEEWDELQQESITDWVALFYIANLRSKSSQTFSSLNFVVQQTPSYIGDIVSRLQSRTMSLFKYFGLDQSPQVDEPWRLPWRSWKQGSLQRTRNRLSTDEVLC